METRLVEQLSARTGAPLDAGKGVTLLGTAGGFTALVSAAACCVLPLAFAAVGLGAGGLSFLVPYHWPLTIGAGIAVAIGWALYVRKRRACLKDANCAIAPPRATLAMLSVATLFVALSALWPAYFEQPLMRLFGGA